MARIADKPRKNRRLRKVEDRSNLSGKVSGRVSRFGSKGAPGAAAGGRWAAFRSAVAGLGPSLLSWVRVRLLRLREPASWVMRGLSLVACVGLFLILGRAAEQHLYTASFFATQEVQVSGNRQLSREQVIQAMGVSPGQNVFQVDEDEARERLSRHPWIAHAVVERRLPGTYRVRVREREAVALIALDQLYLVSEADGVFKPLEAGDPVDLPVVTGVDSETFAQELSFRTRVLVHVVQFLHDYRDAGLWRREPVHEIHLASDESFSVYVGDDAIHVRIGAPPFRKKLRRFRKVLDRLRSKDARASYVYLDNVRRPDRVTVRLR